ncbi:DUF1826 domain-containing protein [Vibrio sp. WJH972]
MSLQLTAEPMSIRPITTPVFGSEPKVFADIYKPDHNIAIWQRTLSTQMTEDIDALLQDGQLALVRSVTPKDAGLWLRNKLEGYACAKALSEDIALIVDMFCCLFDLKEAGVRLTTLDRPMCPKFHVDQIPCRLVTTYAGTATQWLGDNDIDRSKLGAASAGIPDHLSGLFKNNMAINQMESGDVALLKGGGWEGNESTALVHRSPELSPNERRLLLTLDFI